MSLRKLINEILVISPVLLILCITVQARTQVDSFVPKQYSSTLQERICAYIEPVRMAESVLARGKAKSNPAHVRKVAETWRDLGARGVLKPLPPEAPNDTTQEGVKGQIRRASDELAAKLQQLARDEESKGQYERAAKDAILAMEVTQVLKYSDLSAIGMVSVRQSASLTILLRIAPKLSDEGTDLVAGRLESLRKVEKPLAEAVLAAQRTMYSPKPDNRAISKNLIAMMLDMAKAIDEAESAESLNGYSQQLTKAMETSGDRDLLPEFRFAWNARKNSLRNWFQLSEQLNENRA